MSNFQRVAQWLQACGKTGDDVSVQAGCHLEEIAEGLRELTLVSVTGISSIALQEVAAILDAVASNLKQGHATVVVHDRERMLDALCDADVTGNGLAFLLGMKKDLADEAVLAANDAKLVDGKPVLIDGKKIGKPPGWQPADLTPFI